MDIADHIELTGLKFNKYFGMHGRQFKAFMDPLLTMLTHKFDIDIVKFDGWLHTQGYTEEEYGSAYDFVEAKYGQDAAKFINELIGAGKITRVYGNEH